MLATKNVVIETLVTKNLWQLKKVLTKSFRGDQKCWQQKILWQPKKVVSEKSWLWWLKAIFVAARCMAVKRVQFQLLLSLPWVAQYGLWSKLTLSWHDIGLHLCPNKQVTSWQMPKHYDNPGWIMFKKLKGKLLFNTKTLMF